MTITAQDQKWLDQRDNLTEQEMQIIDHAFDQIYSFAKVLDVKAAGDDRAASLEAAMNRFFIESREK